MSKKTKTSTKVVTIILCMLALIVGFIASGFVYIYINKPESDIFVSGDFEVHFMELGNTMTGDCIYIKSGDTDILIDAGSRYECSTTIINYVDQYVTDNTLEFVIATHADQDHIAAFSGTSTREGIFDHYKVETIIDFPLTNKDTLVLNKYREARDNEVAESGAKHYTALECYNNEGGAQRIYQISPSVEMEILYNYYYENTTSDENNYSVCLMFNQGDNHYLFTGDLEKSGEEHLVEYYEDIGEPLPHCVLYKAGHHGSKTSSTPTLMEAISPEYVVVCCCAGSSEYTDATENQFPTQEFINNIAPYTDKVYIPVVVDNYVPKDDWDSQGTVKSMNGNIIFSVTNGVVSIKCSNNDLILKETEWFKNNRTCPAEWL